MQVLEQWCTKKHSPKKCLGKLNSWNNEDWSHFIEKNSKLAIGGLFDRAPVQLVN